MNTLDALLTRRSIRKYTDKEIDDRTIEKLLKVGFSAPSAGNQQPWHFIIVDKKEILEQIINFHPHAKFITDAKKAILVCAETNLETFKNYWPIDCSAATQNILIAARELDLGACWIGIYPREERVENLKKIFKLPKSVIPFSLISLGYTKEKQKEVNRYKKDRVHYNLW